MRYEVVEREPEKGEVCFPWRVLDTKLKQVKAASYRTKDAAIAICNLDNALDGIYGKTVEDAASQLGKIGYSLRVIKKDGSWLPITAEYNPTRINVLTVDGLVTYYDYIG
jgi:hypothetical protein